MEDKNYLVVMGIPSIKKYVFGTDKLAEIRGASALLDNLICEQLKNFFKKGDIVFAGGGTAQCIIKTDKVTLVQRLKELEAFFIKESCGGVRLIWGVSEIDNENYQQALTTAHLESETQREEMPFIPASQLHTGYIRECDSCSNMASHIHKIQKETKLLCSVCEKKYNTSSDATQKLWHGLSGFLKKKGVIVDRPKDFSEIGEQCPVRKGFTALVYADGNTMGKIIKQIRDKDDYRFFSSVVEESLQKACFEAIYEIYFNNSNDKPAVLPAEILLLGGDDLLVYLTASHAFPFALTIAEKFQIETQRRFAVSPCFSKLLNSKGLTISLGIAYGKSHTPFSLLLEQAEELLQSAKKKGAEDEKRGAYFTPSYIDYHFSTNFNQISVHESRISHMEFRGEKGSVRKIYQRPYSLENAKQLYDHAVKLKKSGIPKTRLNRMGNAPAMGKIDGIIEFLNLFTRATDDQRKIVSDALAQFDCLAHMPWKKEDEILHSTVLVDLIELSDFIIKDVHPQ